MLASCKLPVGRRTTYIKRKQWFLPVNQTKSCYVIFSTPPSLYLTPMIRVCEHRLEPNGQRLIAVQFKMADTFCLKLFCQLIFWILRIKKLLFMAREYDSPLHWSGSVGKPVKFSQETCTIIPVERLKQDEWLLGMWVEFITITDLLGWCWISVILWFFVMLSTLYS